MAQHEGYYSPNLDKNTTTLPSNVKYSVSVGIQPATKVASVYVYTYAATKENNKKKSSQFTRPISEYTYNVNLTNFNDAESAATYLLRIAKPEHKDFLSRGSDAWKKIIKTFNTLYYENPNGFADLLGHSAIDEDEVIDMTEIEDTLEHSRNHIYNSHTQHEGYYSPNLTERMELLFNGAELYTRNATNGQPPFVHIEFKGKKGGGVVKSITLRKNLRESLNKCKQAIKDEFTYDWSTPHQNPYILSNTELEKASQALYDFALNYWGSIYHSAFQDQLASTDNKAVYYNFSSGQYDNSTKNVTLKFKSDQKFGTITVTCRSTMYPKVGSLPEMKEYVSNAFYTSAGDHQYLTNNAASKAAVYVWDARNAHFGKANPLSRLQHSALAHADKTPGINAKYVRTELDSRGVAQTIDRYIPEDGKWHRITSYIDYGNIRDPKAARLLSNMSPSTFRKEFIRTNNLRMSEEDYTRAAADLRQLALRIVGTNKTPADWRKIDDMRHSYSIIPSDSVSYLEHHGILGMKWGVRRYQNEDGSLTDAGRKRYGVQAAKQRVENTQGIRNKQRVARTEVAKSAIKSTAGSTAAAAAVATANFAAKHAWQINFLKNVVAAGTAGGLNGVTITAREAAYVLSQVWGPAATTLIPALATPIGQIALGATAVAGVGIAGYNIYKGIKMSQVSHEIKTEINQILDDIDKK